MVDNKTTHTAFGDMSFGDMAQITLNAIGDAVVVADPGGRVIYVNKVAETLTGWTSAEALGKPVDDIFYIVDGTTRERIVSPSKRAISQARISAHQVAAVGNQTGIKNHIEALNARADAAILPRVMFHQARPIFLFNREAYAAGGGLLCALSHGRG